MLRAWPLLALSLVLGCDDPPLPVSCGVLPDTTACPSTGPDTCDDPTCSATYTCDDGVWTLQAHCPGYQGSAGSGGAAGSAGSAGSAGASGSDGCVGVPSHTGQQCTSLQAPDCDVSLIEGCEPDACQLGCEGFLRCENGTWSAAYVAYCDEDGNLIKN